MKNLEIMPDASEVVHYDEPGVRLYINRGVLSEFPAFRADCHWHGDLEFIHVLEGGMDYAVDGTSVSLREGDVLFVNARRLHYGYGPRREECVFTCVLADPRLLTASDMLYRTFLQPTVEDGTLPWALFSPGEDGYESAAAHMEELWRLKEERARGYQLRAVGVLADLMLEIALTAVPGVSLPADDGRLTAQKKMVAFIASGYREELTLDDIAASAAVSRSTCCRIFREFAGRTPGQFLADYRLRVAREQLARTDRPVTQIAGDCGFNDAGYFAGKFRERFGCAPKEYRALHGRER